MAFRRDLTTTKCLLRHHLIVTRISETLPGTSSIAGSVRQYVTSAPDAASRGFFRRFLQRRTINQSTTTMSTSPDMMMNLYMPVGERLREKLREMNNVSGGGVGRVDRLSELVLQGGGGVGTTTMTVDDVRRIVRAAEVEIVKGKVKEVAEKEGKAVVEYSEFVRICVEACGREGKGVEFAKMLENFGNVIVWGNLVFLLPEQVARSMESLITHAIPKPNDPRKQELTEMESQKARIDTTAHKLVKRELYYGLGFLSAQTLAFMRLTFWELSWDVMEPICFFVTSSYFALAYGFFLRTSKEPSFEGYYQRRFEAKQAKLMRADGFDVEKYCRLRQAFYPNVQPANHLNYSPNHQQPLGVF